MKTTGKTLLTILILVLAISVQAQYSGANVGYVKVKEGQWENYLELERQAKKVHQARVEKGIITQWHLYRKMYSGADDPYDFIVVSFFDDYLKSESSFSQDLIDGIYTKDEQAAWMKMARESRDIVKNEFFDQVMVAEGGKPAKYIRINRYMVKVGEEGNFTNLRREIIKPLFEVFIKREQLAGWSMWHKLTYDQEYQYVTVDAFSEFGQWKSGMPYQEVFKEVFPDRNMEETMTELSQSRMPVSSEFWRLEEFTVPAEK